MIVLLRSRRIVTTSLRSRFHRSTLQSSLSNYFVCGNDRESHGRGSSETLSLEPALLQSSLGFLEGRHYSTLDQQQYRFMSTMKDEMDSDEERKLKVRKAANKGKAAMKSGATSLKDYIMTYPRKYGKTFVVTYFSFYFLTLGSLFGVIDSGLVDPLTLAQIELPWHSGSAANAESAADAKEFTTSVEWVASQMKQYSLTEPYADSVENNPKLSNLAIAWVATKLTEPIRFFVALGVTHRLKIVLGTAKTKGDTATSTVSTKDNIKK